MTPGRIGGQYIIEIIVVDEREGAPPPRILLPPITGGRQPGQGVRLHPARLHKVVILYFSA